MPGKTYPAEVKDQALDLVAAEAAANGGKVPRGAYTRAAEAVDAPFQTVWQWWCERDGTEREDAQRRAEAAARARDERLREIRQHATEALAETIRVGLELVQQLGDPDSWPEVMNQKTGQVGAIRPLSGSELAALGRLFREVAVHDRDIDEAMREIRVILDSADQGDLPDHVRPIPEA